MRSSHMQVELSKCKLVLMQQQEVQIVKQEQCNGKEEAFKEK